MESFIVVIKTYTKNFKKATYQIELVYTLLKISINGIVVRIEYKFSVYKI